MTTAGRASLTTNETGAPRAVAGDRFVIACLLAGGIALIPGAVGWLGVPFDDSTAVGAALRRFLAGLEGIRFGSGVRFWLGVAGLSSMAVLLLYPLRKARLGRWVPGSVAGWFKLHLVIGVFAPVAIIYHANFGLGGMNANVALWTMLAVTVSGIIGHFVYMRASAAFYADKQMARRNLDQALSLITSLNGMHTSRDQLAEKLDAFDAGQLMPRKGILASMRARVVVTQARRALIQEAVWVVDEAAREMRLPGQLHSETRAQVAKLLHGYFAFARRAANRSVGEQVWSRWRLFHLPLFLVMCVAAGLHVSAVWDMDDAVPVEETPPVAPRVPPQGRPQVVKSGAVASAGATRIQQVRRSTIAVDAPPSALSEGSKTAAGAQADGDARRTVAMGQAPVAAAVPRPVTRSRPTVPKAVERPKSVDEKVIAPEPSQQAAPPKVIAAAPTPVPPAAAAGDAVAELARRSAGEPKMGLGNRPRTLEEQIATYRAKMKTREFKHSESETGFALTGRHTRAECTDCHKKPLMEVEPGEPRASDNPRACISCHKKDDVHRGRRPNCANCHSTSNWREVRRKR